ncbi:MAG TPA: rhomboid family intramembrane serine protease [Planctomycetes bacterium]|nr:rhomboid family intramembrane serine protease [Planctomycetota bacterium]
MLGEGRWIEVFASRRGRDVRERELVLRARGIESLRASSRRLERLLVDVSDAEEALAELASYERENADWPPTDSIPAGRAGAWEGAGVFGVLLLATHLLDQTAAFGIEWKRLGASHAAAVLGGEPWRALTSLFLHADTLHILSNLVFGVLFGVLATRPLGGGLGWAAILVAATLGNLTNAWIEPAEHVSIGASTAVFAAVGLLGGTEWRRRHLGRQRTLRRIAPLVIALLLYAIYGVPLEPGRVDVMAHTTGLFWGLVLGGVLGGPLGGRLGSPRGQRASAILALVSIGLAWTFALTLGT